MTPGGDPALQLRVGFALAALLVVAAVFVVVVAPRLDPGGVVVDVSFPHTGGLREGAPVIQAGRVIGRVASIRLAADVTGDATVVRLRLGRRHLRHVASNAELFVSSRGVLSARCLEIGPPPDGAPPAAPVTPGAVLRGSPPPSLDRALQRTLDNLDRTRAFADAVAPEARHLRAAVVGLADTLAAVEPRPGAFAATGLRLRGLALAVEALTDELSGAGADPARLIALADRATAAIDHARAAVAEVATAAEPVAAELTRLRGAIGAGVGDRLRTALAEGERALAKASVVVAGARALLAVIERGEGSALRLARDPEFPEDAKELGKLLKRQPWRILGRPGGADVDGTPPSPP